SSLNLHTEELTWSQDTWHHIVATYDGTTAKIYWDGTIVSSGTITGTLMGPSNAHYIGRRNTGGTLLGNLDDVRAYTRSVSPREVAALYQWTPPPVAYWKLDDNTGTTASDSSTNSFTGTLTNGPLWTPGHYGSAVQFNGSN